MGGLFWDSELRVFLSKRESNIYAEIDTVSEKRMLATSPDVWRDYFVEKYSIEPLQIDEPGIQVDYGEARVAVSRHFDYAVSDRSRPAYVTGTRIGFSIPFRGDPDLFRYKPSQHYLRGLRGVVRGKDLLLVYERTQRDAQEIEREFQQDLGYLRDYIRWVERDVKEFNGSIKEKASQLIDSRREKLLLDRKIVEGLGFPIKKREDAPTTYITPHVRRRITVPGRQARSGVLKSPEPAIGMDDYEHILSVISSMVDVMERSPKTFYDMCEQDLRQHFLVQLNGQYAGRATGETFNYEGKTDIFIRIDRRAVFVAECKFWKGPAGLTRGLDQLLGYMSWRDTKVALLVFNRDTSMTTVLEKIPVVVRRHESYKRECTFESVSGFRYIFGHRQDPDRELILTILVFDIPGPRTPDGNVSEEDSSRLSTDRGCMYSVANK